MCVFCGCPQGGQSALKLDKFELVSSFLPPENTGGNKASALNIKKAASVLSTRTDAAVFPRAKTKCTLPVPADKVSVCPTQIPHPAWGLWSVRAGCPCRSSDLRPLCSFSAFPISQWPAFTYENERAHTAAVPFGIFTRFSILLPGLPQCGFAP
jgi:hypothetical protein